VRAVGATYGGVHRLLAEQRGPATAHDCSCGAPAHHWAYTGPREPGERWPFSEDLSQYVAMCRRCHSRYDRSVVKAMKRHPDDPLLF